MPLGVALLALGTLETALASSAQVGSPDNGDYQGGSPGASGSNPGNPGNPPRNPPPAPLRQTSFRNCSVNRDLSATAPWVVRCQLTYFTTGDWKGLGRRAITLYVDGNPEAVGTTDRDGWVTFSFRGAVQPGGQGVSNLQRLGRWEMKFAGDSQFGAAARSGGYTY